jgi:hypothetical protein
MSDGNTGTVHQALVLTLAPSADNPVTHHLRSE